MFSVFLSSSKFSFSLTLFFFLFFFLSFFLSLSLSFFLSLSLSFFLSFFFSFFLFLFETLFFEILFLSLLLCISVSHFVISCSILVLTCTYTNIRLTTHTHDVTQDLFHVISFQFNHHPLVHTNLANCIALFALFFNISKPIKLNWLYQPNFSTC